MVVRHVWNTFKPPILVLVLTITYIHILKWQKWLAYKLPNGSNVSIRSLDPFQTTLGVQAVKMGSFTIISKLLIHNTKNVESIKPFWLLPHVGAVFGHVLSTFFDILVASWSLSVTNAFLDKRGQSDGSEMGSQRACLPATGASILTNLDHQQIQVAIHKYKVMWQSTNTTSEMKNPDVLGQHKIC